jgi:hypothetical protein
LATTVPTIPFVKNPRFTYQLLNARDCLKRNNAQGEQIVRVINGLGWGKKKRLADASLLGVVFGLWS